MRHKPTLPRHMQDFEGPWSLVRVIDDHKAGVEGAFKGRAQIAGGSYQETGTLQFPGQPALQASRRYLWQPSPGGVEIAFEDGRAFHHLTLGQPQSTARHHCPPDVYDVTYDFADWPVWRAVWRVEGLRKDYTMASTYRPLALAAGQGLGHNP